jgi:hypothetical protein
MEVGWRGRLRMRAVSPPYGKENGLIEMFGLGIISFLSQQRVLVVAVINAYG